MSIADTTCDLVRGNKTPTAAKSLFVVLSPSVIPGEVSVRPYPEQNDTGFLI